MLNLHYNKSSELVLFLDRDGVINEKIENNYVTNIRDFNFRKGVLEALEIFAKHFRYIFIVTNQQGIAKGLMTISELNDIHTEMLKTIHLSNGRIDGIFFCPHAANENCLCRKPKTGLYLEALSQFPEIDNLPKFIAGDSVSDMVFGKTCQMTTVMIADSIQENSRHLIDFHMDSLLTFAKEFE